MMAALDHKQYRDELTARRSLIDRMAAVVLARDPSPTSEADEQRDHREPSARASVDLEALARCLTALEGSAAPIIRIPGGQGDGSPAEYVQPWLSATRRALRRLASLRSNNPLASLLLLAVYVYGGEVARSPAWLSSIYLAMLPRERRLPHLLSSRGPDAASLAVAASSSLAAAERAYAIADEWSSDGRWLSSDLDAVSRAVRDLEAHRAEVEAARPKATKVRKTAPPNVCSAAMPLLETPLWFQPCSERARGGLVNARMLRGRAKGRCGGRVCRKRSVDRWTVRGLALVASERRGVRPFERTRPSKTFAALLDAPAVETARPVRVVAWKHEGKTGA